MAIEKTIQTRLINKHALLAEWENSSLALKEGEIALAKVMVPQKDGTEAPTYIAKVGIEGKTFSECPMFFAPASDVYSWAKATTKPGYNAGEITRGDNSNVNADLEQIEKDVADLQLAVGTGGSVANAIKAAIEALDAPDTAVANQFVTAVAETDGKITVTRRALTADDIPELAISKITGLQGAINEAKQTGTDAQYDIDALLDKLGDLTNTTNHQGIENYIADVESAISGSILDVKNLIGEIPGAPADELGESLYENNVISYVDYNDTQIKDRVSANENAIAALQTAQAGGLVRAIVNELPAVADAKDNTIYMIKRTAGLNDKDVYDEYIIVTITNDDDTVTKKFELLGNTELDLSGYALEGNVDTDTKDSNTVVGAKKYADDKVKALEDGQVKANKEAIEAINDADSGILKTANNYADGLAKNYATAEQGTKADTALQSITTTENGGLKVTNNNQIDIDDNIVFVLDCGGAE